MKILLLGGTGAMGKHLSEILSKNKSNEITITSRHTRESKDNLIFIKGNAHDISFIQRLLSAKWDAIIDFMVYSTDEFKKRCDLLLNSTDQYIFLSSSRVYAYSQIPIKEHSPRLLDISTDSEYLQTDEYALTKARQENVLINSGKTNWTIIRPYITYSENRLQLGVLELKDWLPRALQGKTIVFSEDIASKETTLTYGYDVATGIASIICKPKAYGKQFNITCGKSLKWNEVLNIYLDAIEEFIGVKPKVMMLPTSHCIQNDTNKYQVIYDRLYNRIFDSSLISEFCPVSDFILPEIGLKNCILSYIQKNIDNINHIPIDFNSNILYDRITGEYTKLHYFKGIKKKLKYILLRNTPHFAYLVSNLLSILKK